MTFIEHNSHLTAHLDLVQYMVRVMSARVQSDKLPAFYTKTVFTLGLSFHILTLGLSFQILK
jgi:hypothetical protein